jgi:septum formation protein
MKAATFRRADRSTTDGPVLLTSIVLASLSPRRYELLRSLGLDVDVVSSGYDERLWAELKPADLANRHAEAKLRAVLGSGSAIRPGVPVLAADTVVDIDGVALGKPKDAADAVAMLRRLSGRTHEVHTAFALSVPNRTGTLVERETTRVRFFSLEPAEIAEYVATGEPFDKAGAYGIQGFAASLVQGIDGDFYTVMGLPLGRVIRALRRLGFALPKPNEALPFSRTETNADSLR